jgi:hypothetical protein
VAQRLPFGEYQQLPTPTLSHPAPPHTHTSKQHPRSLPRTPADPPLPAHFVPDIDKYPLVHHRGHRIFRPLVHAPDTVAEAMVGYRADGSWSGYVLTQACRPFPDPPSPAIATCAACVSYVGCRAATPAARSPAGCMFSPFPHGARCGRGYPRG